MYPQILERPEIILTKIEGQNVSIAIYIKTQQKIAENQRKNKMPGNAINMRRQNTSLETVNQDKG